MLCDAALLYVKVAGAEAAGLYDLKMENAAIIRKAARDLMVQNHSLDAFGFEYVEYYQMVRDLIEEYRLLFINWVAGFDKWIILLIAGDFLILRALVHLTRTLMMICLLMALKNRENDPQHSPRSFLLRPLRLMDFGFQAPSTRHPETNLFTT
jgi:hypothetical protein